MIESLMEFGPSSPGMSGPQPVSFAEIKAWAEMTKTEMPWYESLLLKRLSRDYCSQYHEAKKPNCAMPRDDSQPASADKVTEAFGQLVKRYG